MHKTRLSFKPLVTSRITVRIAIQDRCKSSNDYSKVRGSISTKTAVCGTSLASQ
jgi:hypothetical protein